MGTPEFAIPSLEILVKNSVDVVSVVTGVDKPSGRGQQLSASPVMKCALDHSLPVIQPPDLKDPVFAALIRDLRPDLAVVVAFRILPETVFTIPRLGSINLHASLLPRYRGAAPIARALMNGETETGVTTFLLQPKVDTGNVLLQARVAIDPLDDAGSLHDKLSEVGAEIVLHSVRLLEQGRIQPLAQDDSLATPAPKLTREDCVIDWSKPARSIHNMVRALTPSPSAFTTHRGTHLKILRTSVIDSDQGSPGRIEVSQDSLLVSTGAGKISILEIQQAGKRRMQVAEFLRGFPMNSGDYLRR